MPAQTGDFTDGNRDGSVTSRLGKTSGEPNDSFGEAVVAVFDERGTAKLQGTVGERGDLDVYLLGSLVAGDRIVVNAVAADATLDVAIAVFDADHRLVANNDDLTPEDCSTSAPGPDYCNAGLDWIVRHDGQNYYVVVTNSPFALSVGATGTYLADIERSSGIDVPSPVGQVLLLNYNGGTIDSPTLGESTIKPFDAASISEVYRGQTDRLKELIRSTVAQNYERFNVTIWTTDDPPLAPGIQYSTIFIGGFNPRAFGIAEDVDLYNADYCDDAIIYAESFDPSVFSSTPTVEQLGISIGNVTSHEAGHLLGLNHVDNDLDLMDDRSAADAFYEDQEFMESRLSTDIMPLGTQDGPLLLYETVGTSVGGVGKLAWRKGTTDPIGSWPSPGGPGTSPMGKAKRSTIR